MEQIIPFRLHIDRAKWDFLLHLEYGDGERARSCGRVTKKVPTGVETSDVTSGGDEGNPRAAAVPVPASARVRASRAAPENARAFPRLRAPNGVRSPERVTKKVPTGVETSDVTSGGDEGNPRAAAVPVPASARVRASRAAPENARAFPRLRAPNGVRSPERVTKKVPTEVETLDVTSGGDEGNRTPDLLTASQALSQLSYAPKQQKRTIRECI